MVYIQHYIWISLGPVADIQGTSDDNFQPQSGVSFCVISSVSMYFSSRKAEEEAIPT